MDGDTGRSGPVTDGIVVRADVPLKQCPFCAEEIRIEAKKCRFCGEFLVDRVFRHPEPQPPPLPPETPPGRSFPRADVIWPVLFLVLFALFVSYAVRNPDGAARVDDAARQGRDSKRAATPAAQRVDPDLPF